MGRALVLTLALIAFVACGGDKGKDGGLLQQDTATPQADTASGKDTAALKDTASPNDVTLPKDIAPGDTVVPQDSVVPKDTNIPDVVQQDLDQPDSIPVGTGCVKHCANPCGNAVCYVCNSINQCVDVSGSLWDQGLLNQAVWGP